MRMQGLWPKVKSPLVLSVSSIAFKFSKSDQKRTHWAREEFLKWCFSTPELGYTIEYFRTLCCLWCVFVFSPLEKFEYVRNGKIQKWTMLPCFITFPIVICMQRVFLNFTLVRSVVSHLALLSLRNLCFVLGFSTLTSNSKATQRHRKSRDRLSTNEDEFAPYKKSITVHEFGRVSKALKEKGIYSELAVFCDWRQSTSSYVWDYSSLLMVHCHSQKAICDLFRLHASFVHVTARTDSLCQA